RAVPFLIVVRKSRNAAAQSSQLACRTSRVYVDRRSAAWAGVTSAREARRCDACSREGRHAHRISKSPCRGLSSGLRFRSKPQLAHRLLFERALTMRDTVALTRAVDSSVIFNSRGRTDTLPREALWQLSQPILTAFPDIRF